MRIQPVFHPQELNKTTDDDEDLLELAELYASLADRVRAYVESRRLMRESFELVAEALRPPMELRQ